MSMQNANFLTIVEASAKLDKSPRTIHRWLEEGRLPGHRVEVGGHERWVVDIDKVKDNDISKPPDAQAELIDLTEEVAWLKEQLQAKDKQIHELHLQMKHLRREEVAPLKEHIEAKDNQISELDAQLRQLKQLLLKARKRHWWSFWRRR